MLLLILAGRQDQQKLHYDKTSRGLSEIYPGNDVRVFNPFSHQWDSNLVTNGMGVVQNKGQTPKSYSVELFSASTLKRNRRHIRPNPEPSNDAGDGTQNARTNNVQPATAENNAPVLSINKVTESDESPEHRKFTRIRKPPDRLQYLK